MTPKKRLYLFLFAISLIATLVALVGLGRRIGPLPPLGAFLSPFHGVWHEGRQAIPWEVKIPENALRGTVRVQIDNQEIPHIFAQYDEDLYYLQGYIEASYRLWQMDISARAAEGRLSEVLGPQTLEVDKLFTYLDLKTGAERAVESILADPISKIAVESYSRGVNDYIQSLSPKDYPVEFKILDYQPELWTPLKTALIIKSMAHQLSGHSRDLRLSRSRAKLSDREEFLNLFPLNSGAEHPIVPDTVNQAAPSPPLRVPSEEFLIDWEKIRPLVEPDPSNGSNSWLVGSSRTATGYPLLANDVHLGFQVPSLWFLVQLSSPEHNVMGASIPGTPGVVIGFNERLAWAVTNGGSDVLDWYHLSFTDDSKNFYLHDGKLRQVRTVHRVIKVRGEKSIEVRVRWTHLGPVVFDEYPSENKEIPQGLAMRWTAHDPSNEILSFIKLNRAKTVSDCRDALQHFGNPQQNFLCADRDKNIGVLPLASIPKRWPGQGRMILDGSRADHGWQEMIPMEELPHSINPQSDVLVTANQHIYGDNYPNYMNWFYDDDDRSTRIHEMLQRKREWRAQDFERMQSDRHVKLAERALPHMIDNLVAEQLDPVQNSMLVRLKTWNFEAAPQSTGMTFFHVWWKHLEIRLWQDEFGDAKDYQWPAHSITTRELKADKESKYWDDQTTEEFENRSFILTASFVDAWTEISEQLGDDWAGWHWDLWNPARMTHLLRIPGWSWEIHGIGGGEDVVNANRGNHGPVWRMVVSLKPPVRAWGIYPGGQSGHPFSAQYLDWVEPWSEGKLLELPFWTQPNPDKKGLKQDWILNAEDEQ